MKITRLITSLLACAALLASCDEKEADSLIPSLGISMTEASVSEAAATQTFTVTSNRHWEVTTDASWVSVEPDSGEASDAPVTVTVTILENTGYNRTAAVKFNVGSDGKYFDYKTFTVTQTGPKGEQTGDDGTTGTVSDPYSVGKAIYILKNGAYTSDKVYVKGKISQINEIDTGQYGNATYFISDDGGTETQLEIYRGYYLGERAKFTAEDQIKVGDEVIVCGVLTVFNGTLEFTQGSYIYSLNGETASGGTGGSTGTDDGTTGTVDDPYSVAKANYLLSSGTYTSDKVYIKGKISQINEIDTGNFGNATYFISDDGTTTDQLEIYRGYYLGDKVKFTASDQIKVGDEVIVYGELTVFTNSYGSTPEVTQGSYIYSLNGTLADGGGNTGGGDNGGNTSGSYTIDFTSSQSGWTVESVGQTPADLEVWKPSTSYGYVASGYSSGSRYVTDSYLISPVLTVESSSPTIAYSAAANYFNGSVNDLCGVYVRTVSANGNGEWTRLSDAAFTENKWTFTDQTASIAAYAGQTVQIAFRYTSDGTDTKTGTLEVKNFTASATASDSGNTGGGDNGGGNTGGGDNGTVTAGVHVFDAASVKSGDTNAGAQTITFEGITMSVTSGILGTNDGQYRIYKSSTLNISVPSSSKITKVVFTCTVAGDAKYGPGCFSAQDGYSYDGTVGTWTGSSSSVSFTASSNQVRATKIEVTVE